MFGDISNINDNTDLLYIITGVVIIDMIVILIARDTTFFGKQINIWYDKFGLSAVVLDVLIIVIGFIITRYIFHYIELDFSPELFIFVALAVQILHDSALYEFIIKPYPEGHNQVIDVYKAYANENGFKIILADSAMVLGSGVLAMYLKNKPMHETTSLLIAGLYIIPYFLYQKAKYP
jgi:RsiW-degrading membrane proteinase PrsW (M82 family)